MLTAQEKKELNYEKLNPDLRKKIDAAFTNPDFIVALTYAMQISALSWEMIERPFLIRGEESQLEVSEAGVQKAIKEAVTARQNTETALKVLAQLDSLSEKLKVIQQSLSPDENNQIAKKVTTAKELRNFAINGAEKNS